MEREFTLLARVGTPPLQPQHPSQRADAESEATTAVSDDEPLLEEPDERPLL